MELKMKTQLAGVVGALAMLTIASASAAPITGSINMYGDFQPKIGAANTQNMALANAIDFLLPSGGGTGTFDTGSGTGTLATFAFSSGGVIKDFSFDPFAPVNTFYTITVGGSTLSFDLTGLTINSQNSNFLTLSGTGTLHLDGYDDTAGNWNFSGQSSAGASPRATFSWSAGSSAIAQPPVGVPEPGSLSLLGLGVLLAGLAGRKRAKAAA
jgi:hypothetical protein